MTSRKFRYNWLPDWLKEHKPYAGEELTGNLIDNKLYLTDTHIYTFIETYENCWSSVYTLNEYELSEEAEAYKDWQSFVKEAVSDYAKECNMSYTEADDQLRIAW